VPPEDVTMHQLQKGKTSGAKIVPVDPLEARRRNMATAGLVGDFAAILENQEKIEKRMAKSAKQEH